MTDATIAGMRAGPVLMSAPLVRATLDGRKTNTRRFAHDDDGKPAKWLKMHQRFEAAKARGDTGYRELLWVRESAWVPPQYPSSRDLRLGADTWQVDYDADGTDGRDVEALKSWGWKRRPSIHLDRWASRLTLEVTATKLERLQDISEEDAIAEGLDCLSKDDGRTWKYGIADRDGWPGNDDIGWHWEHWNVDPRCAFFKLWSDLHGRASYHTNPLVVALTFRAHKANVDDVLKEMAA